MTKLTDKEKAEILVSKGKVHRITDIQKDDHFVVTGQKSIYLVVQPSFCTCDHFMFKCIKVPGKKCKHIMAVEICESPGSITEVNIYELLSIIA